MKKTTSPKNLRFLKASDLTRVVGKAIGNTLQNTAMYGFYSADTLFPAFEKNLGIYDETSDCVSNS